MGLIRSGNTDLTVEDDAELTDYLWPIVREMVKTAIENGQNLIVDGCYIPFDWRNDFGDQYLPHIRHICLCLSETYVEKHFDDILLHACDIESRLDDSSCTVERLKRDNRMYLEGSRQHGLDVWLIEDDYEREIGQYLNGFGIKPV